MPLRDHFRPPVSKRSSWEGFHGGWPMVIVQHLRKHLPPGYIAEPRVRLGSTVEVDVGTLERDEFDPIGRAASRFGNGASGLAWMAEEPAVAVETEPPDEYEYEVRVFDLGRERRLVAAVELVSPANKDRPETRDAFVFKCAALLRREVAVSIVDLVTVRRFNLYARLMELIGHPDRSMAVDQPATYAASCRWRRGGTTARLEAWSYPLKVGEALPTIPLWLDEALHVPLALEASYEQACHDLWIE